MVVHEPVAHPVVTSPVTRKGQVTIPVEIRRRLGIKTPDRVQFVVADDGTVRVKAFESSLERLRGKYKPVSGREHVSFEQMADEAMQDLADETMREMSEP